MDDLITELSHISIKINKQIVEKDLPDESLKNEKDYHGYLQFYSELFTSPDQIVYGKSDEPSDMGTFSSIIPFPEIILSHYTSALYKATFGCFPEVHRFYCTIDNKLFIWSINSKEPEQLMEDNVKVICCACLCGADPILLEYIPQLTYMLVLATQKYIKIFKVIGDKIGYKDPYLTEIDFVPSCIAAGPDGQILVGADSGRIFLVKYDEIRKFTTKSIAYSYSPIDFTYGIFPRLLNKLVGYSSESIVQIVFNDTFSYIAAIDTNSHLRFFNYVAHSNSCTILSFKNSDQYQVASICAAPTIDESRPQFIAFCKNGTRLLIEKKGLTFTVISQKEPPDEFGQDEVMCAQSFMGLTVMACKQKVIFLRGQRYRDENFPDSLCEYVSSHNLADTGISIGVTNSDPKWTDPLIWQHHREPPIVYILTAAGGYKYRFSTPSDQFSRLIISSSGFTNEEIDDYLSNCPETYEPVANSILASFRYPECDDLMIYLITQYSHREVINDQSKIKINRKSLIVEGLIVRISRILEPLWKDVLFYIYINKEGKREWAVNPVFSNISPYLIKQLEHTKEWIAKYTNNLNSNANTIITQTSSLILIEQNSTKLLSSYVDKIIQILSFLGFMSQQREPLLTELMRFFEKEKEIQFELKYLSELSFGDCLQEFDSFMEALRDFTQIIFKKTKPSNSRDIFAKQLIETCPSLSRVSNAEYQITEAMNRLNDIQVLNLPIVEAKGYFPFAVNPCIKYADIITSDLLNRIVSTLVLIGGIPESIQIIEAKVKCIDPSNRFIQSYELDLNDPESKRIKDEIFNYLRMPLSIIEHMPNGLDYLMKSKLKIIHLYIFFELNESNPDLLLSLDSPYILDFLTKNRRDYLWKYLLIQKDNKKIYKEIIKRFSKNKSIVNDTDEEEIIENERIQMLQIALRFARNSNASMKEIDDISKAIGNINTPKKKQANITASMSNDEEQYYRDKFKEIDKDGNGVLDPDELLEVVKNKVYRDQILNSFDPPRKELNFEDFMRVRKYIEYKNNFDELLDDNVETETSAEIEEDTLDKDKLVIFYKKCKIQLGMPIDEYIKKKDSNNDGRLTAREAMEDFLTHSSSTKI